MKTPYIPKPKPPFPHDRKYSWSQHNSFGYSPPQWYKKYVLGEETPPSMEMLWGNVVGQKLASDITFLPEVERAAIFEHELHSNVGDIPLIGFLDSFDPEKKVLLEYKTSRNKKTWTHTTANNHKQIDFYCYLIYKAHNIKPEDLTIKLIYIPCHIENGEMALSGETPKTFNVKKTLGEVLSFANEITERRKEMLEFYDRQG